MKNLITEISSYIVCLLGCAISLSTHANNAINVPAKAGNVSNEKEVVVTFPFNLGTDGQTAEFSEPYFKSSEVGYGTLIFIDGQDNKNIGQTLIGTEIYLEPNGNNFIQFMIRPIKDVTFRPTKVSFKATRFGTDTGYLDISWLNSDGHEIILATSQQPVRENETPNESLFSYEITNAPESSGELGLQECGLIIYVDGLNSSKRIGLRDIVIEGVVTLDDKYITLDPPSIEFADGVISITHPQEGAFANYSILTDDELTSGSEGNSHYAQMPVSLTATDYYNKNIRAFAEMDGWISSQQATLTHSDIPVVEIEDLVVTISGIGEIHYTLDGTLPTMQSSLYQEPFRITSDCIIRAASFYNNLIPAATEPINASYHKCDTPRIVSYDGRYVTFEVTSGETIHYSFDGNNPLTSESSISVEGKSTYTLDMDGLNTVWIATTRKGYDPSDIQSFTSEYYSNETDLFTTASGQVAYAFGWMDNFEEKKSLAVHGVLNNGTTNNNSDYKWLIEHFPALQHLDLSDLSDTVIPDAALDSSNLLHVVLPYTLTSVGGNIFGTNNTSLCVLELPARNPAPAGLSDGLDNPNLLCFVSEKRYASNLRNNIQNVIVNETLRADSITLRHGFPFFSPKEFTADNICFTRDFEKITSIDSDDFGAGWETLSLPFDVDKISNEDNTLKPFGNTSAEGIPFWLFNANGQEWQKSASIQANQPYLIAMPNNPWYDEDLNVAGTVCFSADNAKVNASLPSYEAFGIGNSNFIHANYSVIPQSENIYAINDSEVSFNHTYQPGGIFVKDMRDVAPFECYVTSSSGARYVKIASASSYVENLQDPSPKIWIENDEICIFSNSEMSLPLYDLTGRTIRVVSTEPGTTTRISGLTPGIYIISNKKLTIKNQ